MAPIRGPSPPARSLPSLPAPEPRSLCQWSRSRSLSALFSSTASRSVLSPISRSSWCRILLLKLSSRLRTRACSTSCANRFSSRPPLPTCSRSSAARRSICRRCSTRLQSLRPGFAMRTMCGCTAAKATLTFGPRAGLSKEDHERVKQYTHMLRVSSGRGSAIGPSVLEGQPVQIADVLADPEYAQREAQKLAHYRTLLAAPLLREGMSIGAIALQRTDVRPFTEKQIELVQTFADQAVIAIENARLFN